MNICQNKESSMRCKGPNWSYNNEIMVAFKVYNNLHKESSTKG